MGRGRDLPDATQTEKLLRLCREYGEHFGHLPVATRDVVKWAVETKRIPLPKLTHTMCWQTS
jgi:hypothetical protein